jgi:hypothetical protein
MNIAVLIKELSVVALRKKFYARYINHMNGEELNGLNV